MRGAAWCLTLLGSHALAQSAQPSDADAAQAPGAQWEDAPAEPAAPAPVAPEPSALPEQSAAPMPPAPIGWAPGPLPPDAEPEPYDPARGVPPGYHLEGRVRKGFVISGAIVFGASYGLSVLPAMTVGGGGDDRAVLFLPLAGPFIYLTQNVHDPDERLAWCVVGAGQAIGAALFIVGLTVKSRWIVPDERTGLYVGPMQVGRTGYGAGASLRF
jgi:hypothetical protein